MFGRDSGREDDQDGADPGAARERMVETVASRTRVDDAAVLEALESVPRHEFVPPNRRGAAYADRPLPIGDDQTISAPHMVGIMAQELDLEPGEAVLEVGTGRGYHAAVTAELVGDEGVYTVEYGDDLARRARENFEALGYDGIRVRVGDGREGWSEHAPFDAAYFTAAATEFPDPVVEQVRPGGRLLAPIGTTRQTLVHARKRGKRGDATLERSEQGTVRFVRMRG